LKESVSTGEPARLPAADESASGQREDHDGPDQHRLRKAHRPASEEDPKRYGHDGETSDQSLGHVVLHSCETALYRDER